MNAQPSLWSACPQSLLPCPGNCTALAYAERWALHAAAAARMCGGVPVDASCSECKGRALALVSSLGPLTIRSRGGIPYKRTGQPWEEHAAWRDGLLVERVIGVDWRRKWKFSPGWRAVGRRG